MVLREDGSVTFNYGHVESWRPELWNAVTVGAQGAGGMRGLTYRWHGTGGALAPQSAVELVPSAADRAGPAVVRLEVQPALAGLYLVRAHVSDPEGSPVRAVELRVEGLAAGPQGPIAMVDAGFGLPGPEQDALAFVDIGTMPEGTVTFVVRARDGAGNWGEPARQSVSIDRTGPVTRCTLAGTEGDEGWYLGAPHVTCSATDTGGVDRIEYRVDAGEWQLYTGPFDLAGDGVHLLEYRAVDLAGNLEFRGHKAVAVDSTPPVLQVTGLKAGQALRHSDALRVGVDGMDAVSGLASLTLEVDGAYELAPGEATELWRLGLGPHTLQVRARDWAGNEATLGAPLEFTLYADLASMSILTDRLASRGLLLAPDGSLPALQGRLEQADRLQAAGDRWGARQALLAYLELLQALQAAGGVTPEAYAVLVADANYTLNSLAGEEDCGC